MSEVPAAGWLSPARPDRRRPASLAAALPRSFYERPVLRVAEEMIGCVLTFGEGAGVIVETEAYHHCEPACHAFAGLTRRTATLFGEPGRAYVYRSYGVHALLNAVCEQEGVGAAVLIRALVPLRGVGAMRARRGGRAERDLCSGPGKLTQALGVELSHNGASLIDGPIRVCRPRVAASGRGEIVACPRVGITKAVDLPWRFCLAGSEHVSRPRPFRVGRGRAGAR